MQPATTQVTLLLSLYLSGCHWISGVQVELPGSHGQPPSDVHLYASVMDGQELVDTLDETNFSVSEDGVPLDPTAVHLTLRPRNEAAQFETVLLVDLTPAQDPKVREQLSRGISNFVEIVAPTQRVTVLGFDGRSAPLLLLEQARTTTALELAPLALEEPLDPARNLRGSLLGALKALEERLLGASPLIPIGNLVVVAFGDDNAGRASPDEVNFALDASSHSRFLLSPRSASLRLAHELGRRGHVTFEADDLPLRFVDLALLVRKRWASIYHLRYCSPARSGVRRVELAVEYEDDAGTRRRGAIQTTFDAQGFGPGCKAIEDDPSEAPVTLAPPTELPPDEKAAAPSPAPTTPARTRPHQLTPRSVPPMKEEVVAPPTSGNYR